jgi:hypothetical protein
VSRKKIVKRLDKALYSLSETYDHLRKIEDMAPDVPGFEGQFAKDIDQTILKLSSVMHSLDLYRLDINRGLFPKHQ